MKRFIETIRGIALFTVLAVGGMPTLIVEYAKLQKEKIKQKFDRPMRILRASLKRANKRSRRAMKKLTDYLLETTKSVASYIRAKTVSSLRGWFIPSAPVTTPVPIVETPVTWEDFNLPTAVQKLRDDLTEKRDAIGKVPSWWRIYVTLIGLPISILAVYVLGLFGVEIPFLGIDNIIVFGIEFDSELLLAVTILIILVFGFEVVPVDESVVVFFFGLTIWKQTAGPLLLIPGMMTVERQRRHVIQAQYPGDSDKIFWKNEDVDLPEGMVRPIYATTGGYSGTPTDEQNPLDRQMTVGLAFYVRVQSNPDRLPSFLQNIGSVDDDMREKMQKFVGTTISHREAEIVRQLRDTGEKAARAVFGLLTPAKIIANWDLVSEYIDLKLELLVVNWGVNVEEVGLTDQNLTHLTNTALHEVSRAQLDKQLRVTAASAKRKEIEEEGKGEGAANKSKLSGTGQGLAAQAKSLKLESSEIIGADIAKEIGINADTILVGDTSIAQLIGMAQAGQKAIKGKTIDAE